MPKTETRSRRATLVEDTKPAGRKPKPTMPRQKEILQLRSIQQLYSTESLPLDFLDCWE